MKKVLVNIPESKYVPTLGKGPHYRVYLRETLVRPLRAYGLIIQVLKEENKKLHVDVPATPSNHVVTNEEKHLTPEGNKEVAPNPAAPEESREKQNEETPSDETTVTKVDRAGKYQTTTGRTIDISEEDYTLITKEEVTKQELKDLLNAKGFRTLYKDTLKDLFAKFKIEYVK